MSTSPESEQLSSHARRALLENLLRRRAGGLGGHGPLSENQRGMWFLHQLAPESPAYNIGFPALIRSRIDVNALRRALQALVDRHPVLRTTYMVEDGEPVLVTHSQALVAFEQICVAGEDDGDLRARVVAAIQQPFNLEEGPMLRVTLFTRADDCHVFLMVLHHIAADGWSVWLCLDELRALYRAEAAGAPRSLPPIDTAYGDYVRWQADMLAREQGERSRQYWHRQLAGDLPLLTLPTDRNRGRAELGRVGATESFLLSEESITALKMLARAEGATLYMTLLAVYQALLHRYTGQDDILVGSPVSGRSASRFAGVVGCFVNSVVLRGRFEGEPTFREFLQQTRRTVLDALDHQDYPFRRLTEELHPNRDLRRPPLFQTDFALQKPHRFEEMATIFFAPGTASGRRIDFGGLQLEYFDVHQGGQLDLSLEMMETGRGVLGLFRYDPALFDLATIRRMIGHFRMLLDEMVAHPDERVSRVSILTDEERRAMLVEWNATEAPWAEGHHVAEAFERQAHLTPQAVAVVAPGTSTGAPRKLTYGELNRLANRVAHRLLGLGVGPDAVVAVLMERSPEMIAALLGILKAGGAYLPLEPAHPAERIMSLLEDARPTVLLVGREATAPLLRFKGEIVAVDLASGWMTAMPDVDPKRIARPDALAYVVYTSGSSGRPKGVMIEHGSLANYVVAAGVQFQLAPGDRVLQFASIGFDTAAEEIFPCLTRGATLVLRGEGPVPTIDEFLGTSESLGLTVWDLPTAYWHQITDEMARLNLALPARLRLVIIGGEAARPDRIACWRTLEGHHPRLLNTYGPTETTIVALTCDLTSERAVGEARAPIGRPVPNVHAYVLDVRQQPVPVGVVGELYIGGAGVARGYLNDPVLTAARFVTVPSAVMDRGGRPRGQDGRLYRTGDLVRRRADGNLEFMGRVDTQVKIRGVRIEVGEVEAVLTQHPCVGEAVVAATVDERGDCQLRAYVVGSAGTTLRIAELREFLRLHLPVEMVPTDIVLLEALPRTINNKVDRRALVMQPAAARTEVDPTLEPRTPTEGTIADIYRGLLGLDVGIHESFFDLGGHSLQATRAITRIRETFKVRVPVRAIFELPTVAAMAAHVDSLLVTGRREREEIVL